MRLFCEFLIVFFRMNETLTDLRHLAITAGAQALPQDQAVEVAEEAPEAPPVTASQSNGSVDIEAGVTRVRVTPRTAPGAGQRQPAQVSEQK